MSKAGDLQRERERERRQRPSPRRRLAKSQALTKPNDPFPFALPGRSTSGHGPAPPAATSPKPPPQTKQNPSASTGNWLLHHVKIEAFTPKTAHSKSHGKAPATVPNAGSSQPARTARTDLVRDSERQRRGALRGGGASWPPGARRLRPPGDLEAAEIDRIWILEARVEVVVELRRRGHEGVGIKKRNN